MLELSDSEEKIAQKLHEDSIVIDSHSDIMLDVVRRRINGETGVISRVHIPRMQKGGVDAYFAVIGGDFPGGMKTLEDVVRNIDWMHQEMKESQGRLVLVNTAGEIRKAKENGQIAAFLTMEGYPGISRDTGLLRTLYRLGVRSCAFTIVRGPSLPTDESYIYPGGDTIPPDMKIGLNAREKESLQEMESLGMIPDLSHVNATTKNDILKFTKNPVIASHIAVKGIYDMPYNISDTQIEQVASIGGVLGIACLPFFLKEKFEDTTVMDFVDHVEYIQNLVGIDYIGVGPDFIEYEPDYANIPFAKDLEDTTKVTNITRALVIRGFTQKEIKKILGENFLRVIAEVCV